MPDESAAVRRRLADITASTRVTYGAGDAADDRSRSAPPWDPVGSPPTDDAADDPYSAALLARLRQGAPSTSASGRDDDGRDNSTPPWRWAVAARTAALALVALAAVCAAVVTVAVAHGAGSPTTLPTSAAAQLPAPVGTAGAAGAASTAAAVGETGPSVASSVPAAESGSAPVASSGEPPATPSAVAPAALVIDVVGAVHHPGLVHLPSGARVSDAITAAGGTTAKADLEQVNLARPAVDGEQIKVPKQGEQLAADPAAPAAGAGMSDQGAADPAAAAPVDLNTADVTTLQTLPGIGPVLAERIVAWRTQNGQFTSVDQLEEVSGIGPALLANVRAQARV